MVAGSPVYPISFGVLALGLKVEESLLVAYVVPTYKYARLDSSMNT